MIGFSALGAVLMLVLWNARPRAGRARTDIARDVHLPRGKFPE
jgi:hypothetical protein